MVFSCKICKLKFSVPLIVEDDSSESFDIRTTKCGHLFHWKCLEGRLTHQKLSHAMNGTGPFRRMCPATMCGREIQEQEIIRLSLTPEDLELESPQLDNEDTKIQKRIQHLSFERDQLKVKVEQLQDENRNYREAIEEIKNECNEIRSFLHDDNVIRKGDRIFWVNKNGTLSPSQILEMRRKADQTVPNALIKLERKIQMSDLQLLKPERETFIVPMDELLSFKTFFEDFFVHFNSKLKMITSDLPFETTMNSVQTGRRGSHSLYRKQSEEFSSPLTSGTGIGLHSQFSKSYESINSFSMAGSPCSDTDSIKSIASIPGTGVGSRANSYRRKTIHSTPSKVFRRPQKSRSVTYPSRTSSLSELSELSELCHLSFDSGNSGSVISSPQLEVVEDPVIETEFITVGERVIWYDPSTAQAREVGNIVCLLQYTKCAIVKFDDIPGKPQTHQYRTVQVGQLFPLNLASEEEKIIIFEMYEENLDVEEIDESGSLNGSEVYEDCVDMDFSTNSQDQDSFKGGDEIFNDSLLNDEYLATQQANIAYSCVTAALSALFYSNNGFDRLMLQFTSMDDNMQQKTKQILSMEAVPAIRDTGYLSHLLVDDLLNTLVESKCPVISDPQDFLLALLEYSLKLTPFITYSNGNRSFIQSLTIPASDYTTIHSLQDLLEDSLKDADTQLKTIPAPALLINVQHQGLQFQSMGNEYIIPPVKISLHHITEIDEANVCLCEREATWKCQICSDSADEKAQGFCDDCRHTVADFHIDLDHFPLLTSNTEPSNKLPLLGVICDAGNGHYTAYMKTGNRYSDSWVFCDPLATDDEQKIVDIGSIQGFLENLETDMEMLNHPESIPPLLMQLLIANCLYIYGTF